MKKFSRALSLILVLLMCLTAVFAACKPNTPDNPNPDNPNPDNPNPGPGTVTITLSAVSATLIVGNTKTLVARVSDGSQITSWTSSNEKVATVANGKITAVAAGEADITASNGTVSAICKVKVYGSSADLPKTHAKTYTDDGKNHTYNDYTSTVPSLWNELKSTDSNNDQIMSFLGSSFFTYDFQYEGGKFKADGSINAEGIVPGAFTVEYDGATGLSDATEEYGAKWGLTEKQIQNGGYIWRISLRDDLAWDDGTAIYAEDFVYSMQQQLDPLFQNERADSFYANAVKIHNARDYFYQGREGWYDNKDTYARDLLVKDSNGKYTINGYDVVIATKEGLGWLSGNSLQAYVNHYGAQYFDVEAATQLFALAGADGRVEVTDESIALLEKVITGVPAWGETAAEIVQYMMYYKVWPEVSFDKVGIFAETPYDVIVVLDNPLSFFKDNGELSYTAAYQFQNLPLVKKDLYEKCKVKPQQGSTIWTTTYNTSLETSASWGPYKLSVYQAGATYELTRNEYWYGYGMDTYKNQFQTDKIRTIVIAKEEPAQLAFWAGEVDSLGISVTIADQYKNSKYAMFSPRIANFCINLYSNLDVLKTQGRNNGILAITDFREALSLSLDRAAYNRELSTANKPLLGFMGEDYYYDVENSGVYRYSTEGKEALLRTYGFEKNSDGKWVDIATEKVYDDIDDAVDAMTGYNLALAKEKFAAAWKELTENAEKYGYDPTKDITLRLGASEASEAVNRQQAFIQKWVDTLIAGTPAEGKIKIGLDTTLGDSWSDEFEIGNYDICTGGVGNAPYDPFYMIGGAIADLGIGFHQKYWIASEVRLEFTMPEGDYEGAGETLNLTLQDWYDSLNGNLSNGCTYNWSAGNCPVNARLAVVAMIEEYALKTYYSIPVSRGFTSALRSIKFHYITEDYNTMLGFGDMQFIQYDYTDEEWDAFVKQNNGDLRDAYKVSE